MTARPPRRARKPLVASTLALRTLATAITLSSFGAMTIFASGNLHVTNAPLQPAAAAAAAAAPVATATAAPTTAPAMVRTSRTTVRSSVTSTTTTPVTRTKQS